MARKNQNSDKNITVDVAKVNDVLAEQKDFLVPMVQEAMQTVLEMEME